ncbi:MAG: hypothetical protein QW331_04030 [Candidatus Woesearchaeota archaeon]
MAKGLELLLAGALVASPSACSPTEAQTTSQLNRMETRARAPPTNARNSGETRPVLDFTSDTYLRRRADPRYSFVPDTFLAYSNWQMLTADRIEANAFLMRAPSNTIVIFSNYNFLQKIRERRMATDWTGINEIMEMYNDTNDTRGLRGQISLFTVDNRPYATVTYRLDRNNVVAGIMSLTENQTRHYRDLLRQRQ